MNALLPIGSASTRTRHIGPGHNCSRLVTARLYCQSTHVTYECRIGLKSSRQRLVPSRDKYLPPPMLLVRPQALQTGILPMRVVPPTHHQRPTRPHHPIPPPAIRHRGLPSHSFLILNQDQPVLLDMLPRHLCCQGHKARNRLLKLPGDCTYHSIGRNTLG